MGKNNRGRGNRSGRGRGGGRGGRGRGGGGGGRHGERQNYEKWPELKKESPQMEAYYKAQKIIKEEDWDAFLKAARATLPTTFRISPVVAFADDMKKKLRSHFSDLKIDELAEET